MAFNTYPCNPWPISTEQLNKGNNDDLNARVAALEGDVSDLNDTKANQITIASFFDPEASYDVGDLVYYNGLSYRCTNEHEGEWDADDFASTTIAGELDTLRSGLTVQTLTPVYNTDVVINANVHAYRVGQMVFVEMEYTPVSGTIASNTAILSLLPAPISELWSVNDGYTTLKIDSYGILKYWYPTDTATLTRRNYSFSYITK